jgi:hypothetical protein
MKKLLAALLMLMAFASPVFAAKKAPKPAHPKFDYRYHTPKYKVPKAHSHSSHPRTVSHHQA